MTVALVAHANGWLEAGGKRYRCALGKEGVAKDKREGDHKTPLGRFPLREVLYRPDRLARPRTDLPLLPLAPNDGWCDAPNDINYNRPVFHPYGASAEHLWRDDGLYDIIVIIGHNDDPPVPGRGSAIFLHVAAKGYAGTEGCVALKKEDLIEVLTLLDGDSEIEIRAD